MGYRVTEEGRERRQQHFLLGSLDPLSYHLVLVGRPLKHALGPLDVEEDVGEDADGVLVAPHHEVGEAHVVIGGHLALRHPGVHALRRTDEPLEGRQPPLSPAARCPASSHLSLHSSLKYCRKPHLTPVPALASSLTVRSSHPLFSMASCKQKALALCLVLLHSTPILAVS